MRGNRREMLCFINQRHRKLDILLFNPLPHRQICHCIYKGISLGAAKCHRNEVQEYNLQLAVNKSDEQLPRQEKLSNRLKTTGSYCDLGHLWKSAVFSVPLVFNLWAPGVQELLLRKSVRNTSVRLLNSTYRSQPGCARGSLEGLP